MEVSGWEKEPSTKHFFFCWRIFPAIVCVGEILWNLIRCILCLCFEVCGRKSFTRLSPMLRRCWRDVEPMLVEFMKAYIYRYVICTVYSYINPQLISLCLYKIWIPHTHTYYIYICRMNVILGMCLTASTSLEVIGFYRPDFLWNICPAL